MLAMEINLNSIALILSNSDFNNPRKAVVFMLETHYIITGSIYL